MTKRRRTFWSTEQLAALKQWLNSPKNSRKSVTDFGKSIGRSCASVSKKVSEITGAAPSKQKDFLKAPASFRNPVIPATIQKEAVVKRVIPVTTHGTVLFPSGTKIIVPGNKVTVEGIEVTW